MIEILGFKLSYEAAFFVAVLLFEEVVPYLPFKGNNIFQSVVTLLTFVKKFAIRSPKLRDALEEAEELTERK